MRPRPALRWSVIAAVAFALAAAGGPAAVPIFDGIGNPDEPYRYVNPPAGYRETKPPTTASETVKLASGRSVGAQINTGEFGPQAAIFVPPGAFECHGPDHIRVSAAPVPAPGTLPGDGVIVGNVYRLSALAFGCSVDLIGFGNQAPVLDLRAPSARQPGPVFEHYENGHWTSYETSRVGSDIYRTRIDALGDWALVRQDSGSGSRSLLLPIVAGALGACGVSVGVLAIRRRRLSR